MPLHAPQERDAPADIDAVVLERDLAGFADGFEGREVDHAVDGGVRREDGVEGGFVGDVDAVEGRAVAGDELDAVEGDGGGVVQVVDDDDVVVVLEEGEGREGADVAGPAGEGGLVTVGRVVERRGWWFGGGGGDVGGACDGGPRFFLLGLNEGLIDGPGEKRGTYPVTRMVPTAMILFLLRWCRGGAGLG